MKSLKEHFEGRRDVTAARVRAQYNLILRTRIAFARGLGTVNRARKDVAWEILRAC
jgi:hypothetical protein